MVLWYSTVWEKAGGAGRTYPPGANAREIHPSPTWRTWRCRFLSSQDLELGLSFLSFFFFLLYPNVLKSYSWLCVRHHS